MSFSLILLFQGTHQSYTQCPTYLCTCNIRPMYFLRFYFSLVNRKYIIYTSHDFLRISISNRQVKQEKTTWRTQSRKQQQKQQLHLATNLRGCTYLLVFFPLICILLHTITTYMLRRIFLEIGVQRFPQSAIQRF